MLNSKRLCQSLALVFAVVVAHSTALASDQALKRGKVELQSIGALEIGTDGILFVGDSQASAVYALDVAPPAGNGTGPLKTVNELDEKIAAKLGTGPRDIKVEDMAVHEPSGTVYLSITRGRGDRAAPVLVQVARGGKISLASWTTSPMPGSKSPTRQPPTPRCITGLRGP